MDEYSEEAMKYDLKNKDGLRLCSGCGEWKEPAKFGAQTVKMKNGQKWKGLRPDCRECHNLVIRQGRRAKRNNKLLEARNDR